MNQEIMDLYDQYLHKLIDRREFLKKLSILAGSAFAANALLPFVEKNYANAAIVSMNDSRLHTETVLYPGQTGDSGTDTAGGEF